MTQLFLAVLNGTLFTLLHVTLSTAMPTKLTVFLVFASSLILTPQHVPRLPAFSDNIFFLVKWAPPYADPSHDSWEPYRNLKKLASMHVFLRGPAYAAFTKTPEFIRFARKYRAKVPKVVTFEEFS